MLEILQHCNSQYVPKVKDSSTDGPDQYKVLHKVAFGGDHLTVERGVSASAAVADSDTPFERLEGLILKHEDFHCEMNILQVGYMMMMMMMMMNFIHVSMYLARANWGHNIKIT